MSIKHSIASKKRWAGMSVIEKSNRMSKLGKLRWSKASSKVRRDHAMKMVKARVK